MAIKSLMTTKYQIIHRISEPSRMSDYDYDPSRPERRFYSMYLHTVEFCDRITGIEIAKITFTSEECAVLITALHRTIYGPDGEDGFFHYVNNIFSSQQHATLRICYSGDKVFIDILNPITNIELEFSFQDIEALIELLENEELDNMYTACTSDNGGV